MTEDGKLPEWAPREGGKGFACRLVDGVEGGHDGIEAYKKSGACNAPSRVKRPKLSIEEYADGVLNENRAILGQAITLVESNSPAHIEMGQELLKRLLPHAGNSVRVGITGVPGVGKSTFIEALGGYILDQGHKLAVLAIDPSSSVTGGSILGDKTRMEKLGRDSRCFIRPSPSGGALGGVARKTRETILVCEAAGYDVIFVETVGVGQSEITVRRMVDFFLLLMLAGAGDELQGIKKGIIEIADAILINKADGLNKIPAENARMEYEKALKFIQPATKGWQTSVTTCSAKTKDSIDDVWDMIVDFKKQTTESGVFDARRTSQKIGWIHNLIDEHLRAVFYQDENIKESLPAIEDRVASGELPPTAAVTELIKIFERKR